AAEKAVENVAEVKAAYAAGIRVAAARAAAEIGVNARKAELVVPRALILVGKHLVRFVDLFKFCLGLFIPRDQIRMILLGKLAVRLFDLVVRRALLYAEHLVINPFIVRHPLLSPRKLQKARGMPLH